METAKKAIEALLAEYQESLNTSDVARAVGLYSKTGLVMPPGAPSAQGAAALSATYTQIFGQIQLNIIFTVHSIDVTGDLAVAHTSSKGTVLIRQSGQEMPEENRELFVFGVENGVWKIVQYMFNKTK